MSEFATTIAREHADDGGAIELGREIRGGGRMPPAAVSLPLATLCRHGLVAGAARTGKTTTLQVIAERLSRAGVPALVAGTAGDIAGLGEPGAADGPAARRAAALGMRFEPRGLPVERLDPGSIGPPGLAPPLDVRGLIRVGADGRGVVSLLDLEPALRAPERIEAALLWLLAELTKRAPATPGRGRPALVVLLDDAHVLFRDDGSSAFAWSLARALRGARSRGIGVMLSTRDPAGAPVAVARELAIRIRQAPRGSGLGAGEAVVTLGTARGTAARSLAVRVLAPESRMASHERVEAGVGPEEPGGGPNGAAAGSPRVRDAAPAHRLVRRSLLGLLRR